jgi:hypothetical protein
VESSSTDDSRLRGAPPNPDIALIAQRFYRAPEKRETKLDEQSSPKYFTCYVGLIMADLPEIGY